EKELLQVELDQERKKKDRESQEKERALNERDRLQVELNRANTEKDQEKRRADLVASEKELLQVELDRERQEKDRESQEKERALNERDRLQVELNRANTEKDQEKRRADSAQSKVIRLIAEITRLNQSLLQVTSSAQAITVNLQVPSGMHGHKDANRFIHDNTNKDCTISIDPIISEGIVYYESVFENHDGNGGFGIGIADSSVIFEPDKGPDKDGNLEKTVRYYNDGCLFHISWCPSNQGFKCRQRIGAVFLSELRSILYYGCSPPQWAQLPIYTRA
ncbi:MAG: hypothetical protein EZS28_045697, partial [Streblomastix strix]